MPSVTAAAADFAFAVVAADAASVLVIAVGGSTFPWLTSRSSNFPGAGCCPHRCCSRWPGY